VKQSRLPSFFCQAREIREEQRLTFAELRLGVGQFFALLVWKEQRLFRLAAEVWDALLLRCGRRSVLNQFYTRLLKVWKEQRPLQFRPFKGDTVAFSPCR